MKELVSYLAQALVEHPEEVRVSQVEGERSIILELRVASSDMGKVIGKQGRVAKALADRGEGSGSPGRETGLP